MALWFARRARDHSHPRNAKSFLAGKDALCQAAFLVSQSVSTDQAVPALAAVRQFVPLIDRFMKLFVRKSGLIAAVAVRSMLSLAI